VRVLVTGGAGFIGSHVVDDLLTAGHDVRVLDRLHPGAHAGAPAHLRDDTEYRFVDVADGDAVRLALTGIDAVSHQASMVGLGVDFGDTEQYVRDNDLGTAGLLVALHREGFRGPIVLGSSMVVYGEGRYRCTEHGVVRPGPRAREQLERGEFEPRCPACERTLTSEPVPEDASVDPRNVYAATKLHQEHLVQAYGREHESSVSVLRYHNVYGPRMPRDTPYAGVASIFRSALAQGLPPRVFEDGLDFGGKQEDAVLEVPVQRFDAVAVAGKKQPLPSAIPDCEREHTAQSLGQRRTPLLESVDENLEVLRKTIPFTPGPTG